MSLTEETVRKIARLARLRPDDTEVQDLLQDLSAILAFFEQLQAVDTEGIEPLAHPRDDRAWLRDDEVIAEDRRAQYQKLAADVRDDLYRVPPVLDVE